MQETAILIAIFSFFVPISIAMFLPLLVTGKRWKAAEEKAHARRIADARMNARLLRMNL